jgi:hypothetical protein
MVVENEHDRSDTPTLLSSRVSYNIVRCFTHDNSTPSKTLLFIFFHDLCVQLGSILCIRLFACSCRFLKSSNVLLEVLIMDHHFVLVQVPFASFPLLPKTLVSNVNPNV